ncbi:hypothetical protein SVAN01_04953 [Stagonosporopsis vannaccii]|nr:hypothetical protein SVAN01_04953 [Stagonosporopsis vannaccii]
MDGQRTLKAQDRGKVNKAPPKRTILNQYSPHPATILNRPRNYVPRTRPSVRLAMSQDAMASKTRRFSSTKLCTIPEEDMPTPEAESSTRVPRTIDSITALAPRDHGVARKSSQRLSSASALRAAGGDMGLYGKFHPIGSPGVLRKDYKSCTCAVNQQNDSEISTMEKAQQAQSLRDHPGGAVERR